MVEIRFHGRDVSPVARASVAMALLALAGVTLVALLSAAERGKSLAFGAPVLGFLVGCWLLTEAAAFLRTRIRVRVDQPERKLECTYVPTPRAFLGEQRAMELLGVESVEHPLLGLTDVRVVREPRGSRYGIVLDYAGAGILLCPKYWYDERRVEGLAEEIRRAVGDAR
jgi:hypothetical protein